MTAHSRTLGIFLAGLLAISSLPPPALAQSDSVNPVTSSFDSDNTKDDVLIGFLVVVVGVLIWLGIKSDWDRRQRSEMQQSIDEYVLADNWDLMGEEERLLLDFGR